jgi:hypothetical protein
LNNNLLTTAATVLAGGNVEFFADPPPLDQMNPNGQRSPISTAPLQIPQTQLMPGGSMRIPIPLAPPDARYALFIVNLGDAQGQPATMDFLELPLDIAAQPTIGSAMPVGNKMRLTWPTIPGRMYNVQATTDLKSSFFDVFTELQADSGEDITVDAPMMGSQTFYRILLVPE